MTSFPLLRAHRPGEIFASHLGSAIHVETYLHDIAALAGLLPSGGHVVNLCPDRYRFAVGFAAALCRRQVNLLPPHDLPDMLDRLVIDYPDFYCLTDTAPPASAAAFQYPSELSSAVEFAVPRFAADQPAAVLFTSGSTGRPRPHSR